MTAPEREALVKALREGADFYARERPRAIPCKSDAEIGPNECEAIAKRMDHAADMIEALSDAPAVTVTEERCRAVYREACSGCEQAAWGDEDLAISAMLAIASEAASPRKSERDAVLEEAACIADSECDRHKQLGDRWDEGYATASWHIANSIRALKSTTPQTGSQE